MYNKVRDGKCTWQLYIDKGFIKPSMRGPRVKSKVQAAMEAIEAAEKSQASAVLAGHDAAMVALNGVPVMLGPGLGVEDPDQTQVSARSAMGDNPWQPCVLDAPRPQGPDLSPAPPVAPPWAK